MIGCVLTFLFIFLNCSKKQDKEKEPSYKVEIVVDYHNHYDAEERLIKVDIIETQSDNIEPYSQIEKKEKLLYYSPDGGLVKTEVYVGTSKDLQCVTNYGKYYTEIINLVEEDTVSYEKTVVDENGNIMESRKRDFSTDSNIKILTSNYTTYSNYTNGKISRSVTEDHLTGKVDKYIYQYLVSNDTIIETTFQNNSLIQTKKYFENKEKNVKYEQTYNAEYELIYKDEHWKQENNHSMTVHHISREGIIISDTVYYEGDIEVKEIFTGNTLNLFKTKEYDKNGNIRKEHTIMTSP